MKILVVFLVFVVNYSQCSFMNIFQSKFRLSAAEHPYYSTIVKLAIKGRKKGVRSKGFGLH